MDITKTAKTLEFYISLLGIILLIPIFMPEQDMNIRDLVSTKKTSILNIYCVRIAQAIFLLLTLICLFLIFLRYGECDFPFGVLSYSLFDNIAIAYMIPMFYYITNFGGGAKYSGKFYLFSMVRGNYSDKWCLFIAGIILIIIGVVWRGVQNKFR